ncbi:MAG: T9SS type A sorting domain-containing protein [Candidatus Zophobacter franzmannii]|nr:T9SS type A sorting domain-containing protein [Candidatus Zophobacter franzmannii]
MDYFGVTIGNNGLPAGINHLEGVEGSIAEGLDYTYLYGEYPDYGVDEITLDGADAVLVSNDNFIRVTSYANRDARTIASAIVMGGLYDDDEHTKAQLMNAYIRFLLPTASVEEGVASAKIIELYPAYPNPFNPTTTISFSLPNRQSYSLKLYDVRGRLIRTLNEGIGTAGKHSLTWNGKNDKGQEVNSGVYFARLLTGGTSNTSKLTLIK